MVVLGQRVSALRGGLRRRRVNVNTSRNVNILLAQGFELLSGKMGHNYASSGAASPLGALAVASPTRNWH